MTSYSLTSQTLTASCQELKLNMSECGQSYSQFVRFAIRVAVNNKDVFSD